MKFVQPETYLIGYTGIDLEGLTSYLRDTENLDFLESIEAARATEGLSDGEILASFYAKLCYASLTLGKNSNVTRVRDIPSNLQACIAAGHGSVWGHASINFVTTNCSRVMCNELVRNHIGTEYSQTSGRYVRLENISFVSDPILADVQFILESHVAKTEETIYLLECRLGLRRAPVDNPVTADVWIGTRRDTDKWIPDNTFDFEKRKKITSAIRRIAPNGQANEIGWTINLRALRHVIQMRTSRHAEREIRLVFNQVYGLVKSRWPMIFCDACETTYDGLLEISGMKTQPYQTAEVK